MGRPVFLDCPACEGHGGGPCAACGGRDPGCDRCRGEDWIDCDGCETTAAILLAAAAGEDLRRRFAESAIAGLLDRGYLDGEDMHLTHKGRKEMPRG